MTNKQPERSVEEKWQNKFLNAGTEKGLGDLSMMIGVVSDILQAERQKREEMVMAERERILKSVRNINVMNPEQVNEGFILGFSNCRQRVEKMLTQPTTPLTNDKE